MPQKPNKQLIFAKHASLRAGEANQYQVRRTYLAVFYHVVLRKQNSTLVVFNRMPYTIFVGAHRTFYVKATIYQALFVLPVLS